MAAGLARVAAVDEMKRKRAMKGLDEWCESAFRPCCGTCREPIFDSLMSCVVCGNWWKGTEASAEEAAYRLARSKEPSPALDVREADVTELESVHDAFRLLQRHVMPLRALVATVRGIVDRDKDGPAIAWLNGFADIRDAVYPDTDVAASCREAREARDRRYK